MKKLKENIFLVVMVLAIIGGILLDGSESAAMYLAAVVCLIKWAHDKI